MDRRSYQEIKPISDTILANIQEQIRFADTKAAFLFGVVSLALGFVFSTFKNFIPLWNISYFSLFFLGMGFSLIIGLILCITVVISRFGGNTPQTHIFFAHIKNNFGFDHKGYIESLSSATDKELLEEVGGQILEVSNIAMKKHSIFRVASYFAIFGIINLFVVFGFSMKAQIKYSQLKKQQTSTSRDTRKLPHNFNFFSKPTNLACYNKSTVELRNFLSIP